MPSRRPLRSAVLVLALVALAGAAPAACADGATADPPAPATAGATATPQRIVTLGLLDDRPLEVDQPAPDFVLDVLGGRRVRLSDYRGKTVVLNFWASWCPPCRREMPDFQALWEERGPSGPDDLVILAVNLLPEDTIDAATAFIDEFGVTFPVLFDTARGEVAERYGVFALPATFFIDRDGIVRTTALGTVFGHLLEVGVADADTGGGTYE